VKKDANNEPWKQTPFALKREKKKGLTKKKPKNA
jgi:hypothetical protein